MSLESELRREIDRLRSKCQKWQAEAVRDAERVLELKAERDQALLRLGRVRVLTDRMNEMDGEDCAERLGQIRALVLQPTAVENLCPDCGYPKGAGTPGCATCADSERQKGDPGIWTCPHCGKPKSALDGECCGAVRA